LIRKEPNLSSTRFLTITLLAGTLALSTGNPTPAPGQRSSAHPPSSNWDDHGVFLLAVAGHSIGTEKFEIRSSPGTIEAQAEIHLRVKQNGEMIEMKTFPNLVMSPQLNPLTYTWSQKGLQNSQLEVDFRATPAKTRYKTVSGEEDKRDFDLPKDIVVLDDNVIHHYQLVVDRYRQTAGGKQTFHAFIPQEALPGDLSVEEVGTETMTVEGSTLELHHLIVTTENFRIDLWVDGQQHLQRISTPGAQLEAVRKK
jgi:hypothetical protein